MQIRLLGLQGATSIDSVNVATARMSATDTAAALAKTKLTTAEQINVLTKKGLSTQMATMIATTNTMSSADLYAALTKTNLTNAITAETLAESGLTAEQIAAAVAASSLTAATLAQILARTTLTKDEQIAILVKKGLTEAEAQAAVAQAAHTAGTVGATTATGFFTTATTTAKVAVRGLTAALKANPYLLIIAAVVGLVVAFNNLSTAAVDASEKSKEAAQTAMEVAAKHEEEREQIDQLIAKYQELASQEYIDADTRIEIRDIQKEINGLVDSEVDGLDLVNGKLDEQIVKLKQLQLEDAKTAQSDFVSAYSKAKDSYNDAYVRDVGDAGWAEWAANWGGLDLVVDGWDAEAAEIINAVNGASAGWDSNLVTTLTNIEFYADNAQEYYDIITRCIEAMENDANFNHRGNDVYDKLVAMRKEYAEFVNTLDEATESLINNTITIERLKLDTGGVVVDSAESYLAYKDELLNALKANDDIEWLISDGAATIGNIETLVDDIMSSQFPTYYNELTQKTEQAVSGISAAEKVFSSFLDTFSLLKAAKKEFDETGEISSDTYKKLISANEDYADLFDFSNGKIEFSTDKVDSLVDSLIDEYGATLAANGATQDTIDLMVRYSNQLRDVSGIAMQEYIEKLESMQEKTEELLSTTNKFYDLLNDAKEGKVYGTLEIMDLLQSYPDLIHCIREANNGYQLQLNVLEHLMLEKAKLAKQNLDDARQAAFQMLYDSSPDDFYNVMDIYSKHEKSIYSLEDFEYFYQQIHGYGEISDEIKAFVEQKIKEGTYGKYLDSVIEQLENGNLKTGESGESEQYAEFQKIQSEYEKEIEKIAHLKNEYNQYIDELEENGRIGSTKYYEMLREAENENIQILNDELTELEKSFALAVSKGEIAEGSDEWHKMNNSISSVKESIHEAEIAVVEYGNSIRELDWEYFDYQQDKIEKVIEEAEFLIDLLSNSDLHDEKGNLTDAGLAVMGLHSGNYEFYLQRAAQYAKEIEDIEAEIGNDPYNTKLIERKEELLELQRDMISAAEDEKQAIIDLVKDGIELQLDALEELIDKYTDALDEAQDLYDYQKKIRDATSQISVLQKQLIAYENDESEETRAKIQQIKVELESAQENLRENEYDQFITDQKKLFDQMYDDYSTILNNNVEDISKTIAEAFTTVDENSEKIKETLEDIVDENGLKLSISPSTFWNDESFTTSVSNVLADIAEDVLAMRTHADEQAEKDKEEVDNNNSDNYTPTDEELEKGDSESGSDSGTEEEEPPSNTVVIPPPVTQGGTTIQGNVRPNDGAIVIPGTGNNIVTQGNGGNNSIVTQGNGANNSITTQGGTTNNSVAVPSVVNPGSSSVTVQGGTPTPVAPTPHVVVPGSSGATIQGGTTVRPSGNSTMVVGGGSTVTIKRHKKGGLVTTLVSHSLMARKQNPNLFLMRKILKTSFH